MREDIVKEWFESWFHPEWRKFHEIFEDDVYYSESWGPEYFNIKEIEDWFMNWHKHSKLVTWDIKQFIHSGDNTIVEWYFCCQDANEEKDSFDGVSIIKWSPANKISMLKEFCSSLPKYNPSTK